MPPELSAAPAPQYGMPMNYYEGTKKPRTVQCEQSGRTGFTNRSDRLWGTGSGALVTYQPSPEPIASIPPVQADLSRTNGFVGYCVPPYNAMTYNTYPMPPQ